jgi:hypothetical protein
MNLGMNWFDMIFIFGVFFLERKCNLMSFYVIKQKKNNNNNRCDFC